MDSHNQRADAPFRLLPKGRWPLQFGPWEQTPPWSLAMIRRQGPRRVRTQTAAINSCLGRFDDKARRYGKRVRDRALGVRLVPRFPAKLAQSRSLNIVINQRIRNAAVCRGGWTQPTTKTTQC